MTQAELNLTGSHVPYPYAPGQTKGGDTSIQAQDKAARNSRNNDMRNDALGYFIIEPCSAEGIARKLYPKWRDRYENGGDYLQDCRRRCSELVKSGHIIDDGAREVSVKNPQQTIRLWRISPTATKASQ